MKMVAMSFCLKRVQIEKRSIPFRNVGWTHRPQMAGMRTSRQSVLQLSRLRILLPRLSFTLRTGSVTRSSGSSPSASLYRTLHRRLSSALTIPAWVFCTPRRAPSADGTTLKIADREYPPESTQSDDVLAAFYATDMTVGQILPGTDLWAVERTPADIVQTAEWNVSDDGGRLRTLAVKELSATEVSIEQFDLNDPDAPQVTLNVVRVNDTYDCMCFLRLRLIKRQRSDSARIAAMPYRGH